MEKFAHGRALLLRDSSCRRGHKRVAERAAIQPFEGPGGSALLARDPELAPISMFRLCSERASHISLGESSSVVTVSLCAASLAA